MFNLIKKFIKIPEAKKIIVMGKLAFLKNLLMFSFKIIVGVAFESWFIIAIALYGLCIGFVKNNCAHGLKRNKDSTKDIHSYVTGGTILSISSLIYIVYSYFQIYYPSNSKYTLVIGIIFATFAFASITVSILGLVKARGKTMLIKEYKLTNFATALNSIVLAQIAILSFTSPEVNVALYNGIVGIICGIVILAIGIYLIIDGYVKKRRYERIIKNYPEIVKYLNNK